MRIFHSDPVSRAVATIKLSARNAEGLTPGEREGNLESVARRSKASRGKHNFYWTRFQRDAFILIQKKPLFMTKRGPA